jgi:hypothetical protein
LAFTKFSAKLEAIFKGIKPLNIKPSLPRFEKVRYDDFLNLELKLPRSMRKKNRRMKTLDKVIKNAGDVYIHNQDYKGIISKKKVLDYEKKRMLVKQKKAEIHRKKVEKTKENLNKFLKKKEAVIFC